MIRHRKGPGVIARLRIPSMHKPHYIMAYLWESIEAMNAGAKHMKSTFLAGPPGARGGRALGLCCPSSYGETYNEDGSVTISARPLIAEVHFVKGRWKEEIVAHELMHAVLHRMRCLPPWHREVCEQKGDSEETICHEYGRWFVKIFAWLWEIDGYGENAEA